MKYGKLKGEEDEQVQISMNVNNNSVRMIKRLLYATFRGVIPSKQGKVYMRRKLQELNA